MKTGAGIQGRGWGWVPVSRDLLHNRRSRAGGNPGLGLLRYEIDASMPRRLMQEGYAKVSLHGNDGRRRIPLRPLHRSVLVAVPGPLPVARHRLPAALQGGVVVGSRAGDEGRACAADGGFPTSTPV